jgi:exonuclease SbcD
MVFSCAFFTPCDVPKVENAKDAYLEGIAALYQQTLDYALSQRHAEHAIIAMGHCHMLDGEVSTDSERKLVMGGIEALSTTIFAPEIQYVALGHLHLAQQVGDDSRVHYSGTPLPMSFSEEHYQHAVRVVEFEHAAIKQVSVLRIPRVIALHRIPAHRPEPLEQVLSLLTQQNWPELAEEQQPYLLVRVLLDKPEPSLRQQIEQVLTNKAVRLVKIETTYPTATDISPQHVSLEDVQRLQAEDVFLSMYQQKFAASPSSELLLAFRDLLFQYNSGSV